MASNRTFVRGAMILTAAAVISKLFGSVYTIVLQNMIGDQGMGIYQMAYPVYATLLVISTAGFPVAISKYVSEYTAVHDMKNAQKIFRVAFFLLAISGFVGMIGLYLFSGRFAAWAGDARASIALKAVAPALFIVPILSSIRGYFQGWQSMRPTAVSQVVEQFIRVATILIGVILVLKLGGDYGEAAAVASFGAVTGGLAGLAVIVYELWKFTHKGRDLLPVQRDTHDVQRPVLGSVTILRKLIYYAVPVSLSAMIIPLISNVDAFTVTNLLKVHGISQNEATHLYGLLSGRAFKLLMLPATLASSIGVALLPAVSEASARSGKKVVKERVSLGMRFTLLLALPAAVGLIILAKPIDVALFRDAQGYQAIAWMGGAALFSSLQMNAAASLQGMGFIYTPLYSLLIGTLCKIGLNLILVPLYHINGAAAATAISYGVAGILNLLALKRELRLRFLFNRHIMMPFAAVFTMGAFVYAVLRQWGIMHLSLSLRMNAVVLVLIAIGVGALIYVVMLLISGLLSEGELRSFPKIGAPLVRMLHKIGFY